MRVIATLEDLTPDELKQLNEQMHERAAVIAAEVVADVLLDQHLYEQTKPTWAH